MEFNKIDSDEPIEAEVLYKSRSDESRVLETKREIAIELLMKNSSKQFIIELTGFTLDEIYMLEKECGINNI